MRDIFTNTLIDIAKEDEKVVLLMAEVGYGVVEPFERLFPERFYNTGISEQNLVLTAAGMAMRGYHPVAYSMSSFLPSRAFEMIKDSVCYQNLPVTLVGIGSGVSYGKLGTTHHAVEESALMRVLPNMEVIFPADGDGCRAALKYALKHEGPVYIGLEKTRAKVQDNYREFDYRWEKIISGDDAALFACGTIVFEAIEAAKKLEKQGIYISIYKAESVKPLDYAAITEACRTKHIFVVDEHAGMCGLGAEIANFIMVSGLHKTMNVFYNFAIPDRFPDNVWDENKLLQQYGLCSDSLTDIISKRLKQM